jgi:hypothetical protein
MIRRPSPPTTPPSSFLSASAGAAGTSARADAQQKLLHTLFSELFQTEQSADEHSRREAERLGSEPPANALRAVADHARAALMEFSELAKPRGFSATRGAMAVGSFFSRVRDLVVDRLVDRERSYRGTLLGMRHGMDLVRSLRFVAEAAGDPALVASLDTWLRVRAPLVEGVSAELAWFARNPERALEGGTGSMRARIASVLRPA